MEGSAEDTAAGANDLIEAAGDRLRWAEMYERDLRNAVQLQGEAAESIAAAIETKVTLKNTHGCLAIAALMQQLTIVRGRSSELP